MCNCSQGRDSHVPDVQDVHSGQFFHCFHVCPESDPSDPLRVPALPLALKSQAGQNSS